MNPALRRPILGVCLAIAITTAMDASGLSAYSALPLFPLMGVFWFLDRLPRRSVGLVWGRAGEFGLAVAYPVLMIGLVGLIAAVAGATDVSKTSWRKAGINFALITISTTLVAILTEEGFFRGWLWSSLEKAGKKPRTVLVWTSVAFSLWHLSAVTLQTGFNPPPREIPVFMINAAVLGAVWGLLRWMSGSVIVSCLSHGVWNGLAYVFFGFGVRVGALGIANTAVYGPEVGVLGLAVNVVFAAVLWRWWNARVREAA